MGEYRNGRWIPTFGDVQAGVSDWAPGEQTPQDAIHLKQREINVLHKRLAEVTAQRDEWYKMFSSQDAESRKAYPTLDMRERIAELERELAIAKSFHDVAVKERDYERVQNKRYREALEDITEAPVCTVDRTKSARNMKYIAKQALGDV